MLRTAELAATQSFLVARGANQFLRLRLLVEFNVALFGGFTAEVGLGTHPALKKGSLCFQVLVFLLIPYRMPVKHWLLADLL